MSLFLSFLGGAAGGLTEKLESTEKEAKTNAILGVKAMTERYQQVAEENRNLKEKLSADKEFILAYHPNATPEQINEIIARPTVMDAFKKYKDPSSINLDTLVKIASNNSIAAATGRVEAFPEFLDQTKAAVEKAMPKRASPLGRLFDEAGQQAFTAAQNKALLQAADALGVSVEELKNQRRLERPTARGEVDMSVFVEKPEFKDIKDKAQTSMLEALQTGDDNKIKAASETVARIVQVEEQGKTKNKTEEQIQTDLRTRILEAKDPKEKQQLTNQLRQRQALEKAPAAQGKTDADKISQSNLIVAATKTRDAILADVLPPGSFVVTVDPNSGASTLNIKELEQPELYKKGVEAARNAIIKEYTNPQTGMPRSEMHKNAMMSVGIQFDQTGRPVGGGMAPPPAPAAGMPAPKTKAEYDAIPSGTQYRDTDGKVKIKR